MEICVTDTCGVPDGSVVSVRLGGARRQAQVWAAFPAVPFTFPTALSPDELLTVDVFAPLGSGKAEQPQRLRVPMLQSVAVEITPRPDGSRDRDGIAMANAKEASEEMMIYFDVAHHINGGFSAEGTKGVSPLSRPGTATLGAGNGASRRKVDGSDKANAVSGRPMSATAVMRGTPHGARPMSAASTRTTATSSSRPTSAASSTDGIVACKRKRHEEALSVKDYFGTTGVLDFVQNCLHLLITEKPHDPFAFLTKRLEDRKNRVLEEAQKTVVVADVNRTPTGTPEGGKGDDTSELRSKVRNNLICGLEPGDLVQGVQERTDSQGAKDLVVREDGKSGRGQEISDDGSRVGPARPTDPDTSGTTAVKAGIKDTVDGVVHSMGERLRRVGIQQAAAFADLQKAMVEQDLELKSKHTSRLEDQLQQERARANEATDQLQEVHEELAREREGKFKALAQQREARRLAEERLRDLTDVQKELALVRGSTEECVRRELAAAHASTEEKVREIQASAEQRLQEMEASAEQRLKQIQDAAEEKVKEMQERAQEMMCVAEEQAKKLLETEALLAETRPAHNVDLVDDAQAALSTELSETSKQLLDLKDLEAAQQEKLKEQALCFEATNSELADVRKELAATVAATEQNTAAQEEKLKETVLVFEATKLELAGVRKELVAAQVSAETSSTALASTLSQLVVERVLLKDAMHANSLKAGGLEDSAVMELQKEIAGVEAQIQEREAALEAQRLLARENVENQDARVLSLTAELALREEELQVSLGKREQPQDTQETSEPQKRCDKAASQRGDLPLAENKKLEEEMSGAPLTSPACGQNDLKADAATQDPRGGAVAPSEESQEKPLKSCDEGDAGLEDSLQALAVHVRGNLLRALESGDFDRIASNLFPVQGADH